MLFIKKKINIVISASIVVLFMTGCAQKTQIKAIKAAKVTDSDIKHIGVASFKNDKVGQADQINSEIFSASINGKKYFNLVDRENIKMVMKEKELNDSGLVDLINNNDSSSGLQEIKTLVTGTVLLNDSSVSNYLESRIDYQTCRQWKTTKKGKKYCAKYRKYNVRCKAKTYSFKTNVKLIKIANSGTMFSNTYEASMKQSHCADDDNVLPSRKEAGTTLAGSVATQLLKDIAPSYVHFTVKLLDDPDIEYTDAQEKLLENALALIKQDRMDKANGLLSKLNDSTRGTSYVALYNLGVTEEALGNVAIAYELFKKAEDISLMTEIIDEISLAVKRSKRNLAEFNKTKKQM